MSVEAVSDVENRFLSRREIVCEFDGAAGSLTKLRSAEAVSEKFGLSGKAVLPISLRGHAGRRTVTGTFYVYDDEALARRHVNPSVMARIDKARAAEKEAAEKAASEAAAAPDGAEAGGDKPDGAEAGGDKPDGAEAGGDKPDGAEAGGDKPDGGG